MLLISDDDSNANSSPKRRRRSSLTTNLIHHHHDEISHKEQQEIAEEMVNQLKQLQADNAAMGFHENQYNKYKKTVSFMTSKSKPKNNTYKKDKNSNNNRKLPETDKLKHKLESISTSINRIRDDLRQRNEGSSQNNNSINGNNIFMYFQNQLTDIQDQIDDAHDDIESNIDVKFIKYIEEIKTNKEKLKMIKKDQKQQERLQKLQKQKEQQQIIEQQRAQIEILMQKKSVSKQVKSEYLSLDHNPNDYVYANTDDSDEYATNSYNYYNYNTPTVIGYEPYINKPQRLLSDNSIKIISGVAVVVTGLWIVSKIFDKSNRNSVQFPMGRLPILKY